MTRYFGTMGFFLLNAFFFLLWILVNEGIFPNITPFDPFPYGLLTSIVSLEAIFLSIIVLVSQNRESRIADLRQELDFEINVRAEEEITHIIHMLDEIHDHIGLHPHDDRELRFMKKKLDIEKMAQKIEKNQ